MARRPKGALLINPRRRMSTRSRRVSVKPGRRRIKVRTRGKRRTSKTRRAKPGRRRISIRRRNPATRFAASPRIISVRTNPVRRKSRRKAKVRRNPAMFKGLERSLGKVPLVGPVLASIVGFAPPAAIGAASVFPMQAVTAKLAEMYPTMPASYAYIVSGLGLGVITDMLMPKLGFKPATARMIAVAFSTAGGALGVDRMLAGQESTAGEEMGRLLMAGTNPLGQLLMTPQGMGRLIEASQPYSGALVDAGPAGAYAGYGPQTVGIY